ncbi:BnaAnng03720D [Brassica napus]|uniref:BnaAnng03720D protein n=1 Tax=Brassica napus TaxID=3708 RepID=A0A078GZG5_BRANA|nr:BnaAnng03720D [Brassica napus]
MGGPVVLISSSIVQPGNSGQSEVFSFPNPTKIFISYLDSSPLSLLP